MPDRQGPSSRWSSAREREERDRQRAAAREEAKRARLARESGQEPEPPAHAPGQRGLTEDERRTISQYRFPAATGAGSASSTSAATSGSSPEEPAEPGPRVAAGVSTRWRDSAPPPPGWPPPSLPNLPGDEGGGRKRPPNSRLLIFGLGLFALMAVIAFLPFGPFGGDDEPATPTPSAPLPSILEPDDGEQSDAEATSEAQQPVAGENQFIVCIDPGHGGWDPGWERLDTSDPAYQPPSVTEAELNLGMAWMLKAELEANGIFVVMTRESGASVNTFDEDINGDGQTRLQVDEGENAEQAGDRDELQARINVCNEAGADILISLHINGFDDRSARGYEVIYTAEREFGAQNEELATLIYRQMDTFLRDTDMGGTGRGWKPDTESEVVRHDFGTADHYLMTGPAVESISITPSEMPGVIVEAAFLSNDADAAWIVRPENQQLVVDAYTRGILDYLDRHPPGG